MDKELGKAWDPTCGSTPHLEELKFSNLEDGSSFADKNLGFIISSTLTRTNISQYQLVQYDRLKVFLVNKIHCIRYELNSYFLFRLFY